MHTKHRHEHRSNRSELYFAALSLSRRTDLPPRSGTLAHTHRPTTHVIQQTFRILLCG